MARFTFTGFGIAEYPSATITLDIDDDELTSHVESSDNWNHSERVDAKDNFLFNALHDFVVALMKAGAGHVWTEEATGDTGGVGGIEDDE